MTKEEDCIGSLGRRERLSQVANLLLNLLIPYLPRKMFDRSGSILL